MTVTPMMAQYLEIKDAHKDALLFYRMGDFYEMFFEDAVAAAAALDIALTKRGKHNGDDIPMCGVPVHAAEGYFLTLIRKGFRVAVCEQLESPAEAKKRGYKAVVKRGVTRIVTPGTLTEDTLLEARRNNYLAAYVEIRETAALAWADVSTGDLRVLRTSPMRLGAELARLRPAELIVSEAAYDDLAHLETEFGIALTEMSRASFDSQSGSDRLLKTFKVGSLDAFGQFDRVELAALGALIAYVELTQKGKLPSLARPKQEITRGTVQIDAATRRNLELTQSMSGGRAGSLLSAIDETVTASGARLLERFLASPSQVLDVIQMRQACVGYVLENDQTSQAVLADLKSVPDIERALSRLSLDRGGPRDLGAVRSALQAAEGIAAQLTADTGLPNLLADARIALTGHDDLSDRLDTQLTADLPIYVRDGDFIAPGANPALDEARRLRDQGRQVIAKLQGKYQSLSGVSSLKIKHNNVLGYFVETPATHAKVMMADPLAATFIHRQTTANQVRFTTTELSDLERKILAAGDQALRIERDMFETLRQSVLNSAGALQQLSVALAQIDVFIAFAGRARREDWIAPKLDDSRAFRIVDGRHPVVEAALKAGSNNAFVANSVDLTAEDQSASIWLLTGPNMSGKSTFLRQNALIAILAQIGSYVPAREAHIGCVSQIFSRVGASDDLARGRSTFMVEMVETAAILNQSDDRALVILDEIGRGTATYDGLSIAWAALEYLHDINRCRALFATHYHEMTGLSARLDGLKNATIAVKEWDGDVVFLHEVREGSADRSYGVQVAKLAGLPEEVIARARLILDQLEQGSRENAQHPSAIIDDLPLFAAVPPVQEQATTQSPVLDLLDTIQPDELSPREALDLIYKLKASQD